MSNPTLSEIPATVVLPDEVAASRRPALRRVAAIGALVALALVAFFAVRSRGGGAPVAAAALLGRDVPSLDGELIRYSDDFARRAGLVVSPVRMKELLPLVSVTGTVTYDVQNFAAVGARIAGRVRRVFKVPGDQVRVHEALAELESAELGRAESLVLGARAKEMAAEAHMKRERRLADGKITAERDAELAKAEFEAARAERVATEHSVTALGGDLKGEVGILLLKAPLAGKVIASKISRGQTVSPNDTAFEVANLATLWVELRVFERDLSDVRVGDAVEISTQGAVAQSLRGKVAHVGDVIDVETRSAPVRVVVENREGTLRPGQSVHARVHTAARTGKLPSVPRVAVTRIDGKSTVFVVVGKGVVSPRQITIGSEDGKDVAVTEGLREGEQIIGEGMFALKSEIFR